MSDEINEELWGTKGSIARGHGNDVRKLAGYLQGSDPEDSFVSPGVSAVDVLNETPVHGIFKNGEDVESRVRDERASWNK